MNGDYPKEIELGGEKFYHLKNRLMGGAVYANKDGSLYARAGTESEVRGEMNLSKELESRHFPVPKVLNHGSLSPTFFYYVEESVGQNVFGRIFMDHHQEDTYVSDEDFDAFLKIIKRYAESQFNQENYVSHNPDSLDQVIELANVLRNNPPTEDIKDDFYNAYERASKRVQMLPWGFIQADLNAFNILPNGIIDFELAYFGPIGYDIITCLFFGFFWPQERIAYLFTDKQIKQYLTEIDTVALAYKLPKVSDFREDFLVLKSIWCTAMDVETEKNPGAHSKFYDWRIRVRNWCIKQYLAGKPIDVRQFEEVGSG